MLKVPFETNNKSYIHSNFLNVLSHAGAGATSDGMSGSYQNLAGQQRKSHLGYNVYIIFSDFLPASIWTHKQVLECVMPLIWKLWYFVKLWLGSVCKFYIAYKKALF